MKVGPSITEEDRIFLVNPPSASNTFIAVIQVWPTTLCHVIDKDSPFWEISSDNLPVAQFEIVVLLEGRVVFIVAQPSNGFRDR
jgi:hypothetical protein